VKDSHGEVGNYQDSNGICHYCNLGSLNNLWLNLKLCLKHAMTNSTIYLLRKVVSFVLFLTLRFRKL
jgi:hypothetical protein